MPLLRHIILFLFVMILSENVSSQVSNMRSLSIVSKSDTLTLDTLSIFPGSFKVYCGKELLSSDQYHLDHAAAKLILLNKCSDTIITQFRVLPMNLSKSYSLRDTSKIYTADKGNQDDFRITSSYDVNDVFGGSSLNKSGSISRGVSFGNNQDLGVNSTLNLELSGDIAPNLKLIASLSDDNMPIQPDGNTNKLQEFDQVFIQLYNDRFKTIAGDFWLYKPKGYFMNYRKRGQGLTTEYTWTTNPEKVWKTQVSGALSKGKFNRQVIQGVEGNQGPYRLRGAENEPFITILSGTERVFIDGKQLERGQEYDYTINYNTAEVIFTSRNMITKDSRIVVEFQYSDLNYARSLLQTSTTYTSKKTEFWINAYTEQDAKNQTLQQELSFEQKQLLSSIGDSIELARTNSIDSIGYFENQVMYRMIDSLGYDSVLVYSVNPSVAVYRAVFTFVGQGKGNYVFSNLNALGKVYKWVEPIGGVPQGDHEPSRLIITPKQRRMVSSGFSYALSKKLRLESEVAYTGNDLNTFSSLDREDDAGYSNRTRILGTIPLSRDSLPNWQLETKVEVELLSENFVPIEQYRTVEFDRDWNTRNKGYTGRQIASSAGTNFKHRQYGNLNAEAQHFTIGNDYEGLRGASNGNWSQKGFRARWDASYLSATAERRSEFIRHRSEFSQQLGKKIRVGYLDDHEFNRFTGGATSLDPGSYQFFDYQFYLANGDSTTNQFKVFYRERYDRISDSSALLPAAKARTTGGELNIKSWTNHRLNLVTGYRQLVINDSSLILQKPESSLLGRIDYEAKFFKGALTFSNFYEIGSGLEQRREFLYIQVNAGQGIYTWIDYNGDGIKDLNEFEIAQFVDQAEYIRVFTPSNDYVRTYSNELNQSIFWRPERLWNNKKGALKFLSRFSDQARIRINRKTTQFDGWSAFNPYPAEIRDTNLISTGSNLRNTVFFNRTSSIFGGEYTFQQVQSKTLLATGFDSRANLFHELSFRWNIQRTFSIENKAQIGTKVSEADYTSGRNYELNYFFTQPAFIFQPTTTYRVSLEGKYAQKENSGIFGGERAEIIELGTSFKYNQSEKGSLQGNFKWVEIRFDGNEFSALGFEMLEGLRTGTNFTWNIGYQRSVSRNLQLNLQYNGRRSENSRTIHSGGMEIRAFF
jgi:hypothetical protein